MPREAAFGKLRRHLGRAWQIVGLQQADVQQRVSGRDPLAKLNGSPNGGEEDSMKKSVLPQPKRRPAENPVWANTTMLAAGQLVEVTLGELAGARGTLISVPRSGRWVVKLDGMPAGVYLSIPKSGLRLLPKPRE